MGGEEDAASGPLSGSRKTFWRSASWSSSRISAPDDSSCCSTEEKNSTNGQFRRYPAPPLTPRSQSGKARSCLPPLQPLSIVRRSLDDWPKASCDDVGEWPQLPTPSGKASANKPGEGMELDLSLLRSQVKKDQIAFFDKECSKVADHIYLGGDSVARNREILRRNGITHVLNCVGFVCPEYFKSDLVYKTLWLQDSPTEDITSILYDVFDYFEDVREQGGRVLVHCCQGVSRSTSLVIAYLMWRKGQSFEDAFQYVKAARGIANPNMGFACQLLQCQKRVHAIPLSPSSVLRMYRMAPHSSYDPLHLVPKMLNDPSPDALDSRGAFIIHVLSSIYVWIGKNCKLVMEKDAKAAAFQVVRYERVQGPIMMIEEGDEPPEFWEAFASAPSNSDSATKIDKEQIGSAIKAGIGKRRVESYDGDFELFYKAITGGVVPAFSSSGPGQETNLPARESNWSILRRKFLTKVYSDPALVRDMDPRMNRVQLLTAEASTSPPYLSPSSLSSDLSISSKCSSESFSMSPSTSSSHSLTPSPASSNSPDPLPPSSRPSLQPSSNMEPLKHCWESGSSPSKGLARSIAERRGSFSPLKLSSLNKNDAPVLSRKVLNTSSANEVVDRNNNNCMSKDDALDREDNVGEVSDVKCTGDSAVNSSENRVNSQKNHLNQDDQLLPGSTGRVDVRLKSPNLAHLLVYRWPSMEELATFATEDLDSKAVFLFLTPNAGTSGESGRILYLWVGRGFKQGNDQTQLKSSQDLGQVIPNDWHRVGCEFLDLMGLQKDLPIKVVKEQETEKFLEFLNYR
ncbi:protein-tyrosine-phosphatase MKP1 [Phoenix dactylifera]|uniref:Protein-tyrosine-phosphatase MKP1 n=1 Tax=Phoenix dactylifera TaxID=42345 RepID=A0A8B9AAB6_PHODC|nr:protein-tyrosine-phosphatase MKP1 [Phoenix dactylifera]XP_038980141.1 protein-tyrosine-phosphatase MKP1 [Phoenix dactylifera]XP_038980142.1 protein-tyrosine-phosphatase MKP1 [Phoenix dactylifera]XP_038980143.1 protein-tyrosine-phosphatase MKP1 [Phoenix dactylifera]XP_038980144.1 protein-tyrosine-phosphatase MKP1 [Phoenix dactylifera]